MKISTTTDSLFVHSSRLHVHRPRAGSTATRKSIPMLVAAAAVILAACGGGGGGGADSGGGANNGGGSSGGTPVALALSVDQTAVLTGNSVTIKWISNFTRSCQAGGNWSGTRVLIGQETVPVLANSTFTLTCSGDGGTETASVNVNALPVAPVPTATEVVSNSGHTSLSFARLPIDANGAVWDAANGLIHFVTVADAAENPSSLISVDPIEHRITAVHAFSEEPKTVAVTQGGEYLYVGFNRHHIQRFIASTLTPDIQIEVGTEASRILRIVPSPASPETFAVIASNLGVGGDSTLWGLQVLDNQTPRPKGYFHDAFGGIGVADFVNVIDADWSEDGDTLYGQRSVYLSGVVQFSLTAEGLEIQASRIWNHFGTGLVDGNTLYSHDGRVYDLESPMKQLGNLANYHGSGLIHTEVAAPDRGKAFATFGYSTAEAGIAVESYDLSTYTRIDRIEFTGAAAIVHGGRLIPWGTDGFALLGSAETLIAQGTFAAAGGLPPRATTAPVIASGVSYKDGQQLRYRAFDYGATDIVADTCGHLYASISGIAPSFPNSIVSLDTVTGAPKNNVFAGSEPQELAISDDCSKLYTAFRYSNSVSRLRAQDLTVEETIFLDKDEPQHIYTFSRARSLSVAPGQPDTFAAAKSDMGVTLCDSAQMGITIFDGSVERPIAFSNDSQAAIGIAWGSTGEVLYGDDGSDTYMFAVDSNGPGNPRALFPRPVDLHLYSLERNLHFDRRTNRLFDAYGQVYDAARDQMSPSVNLVYPTSVGGSVCSPPMATRTTDAQTGKIYFASPGFGAINITTYDANSLANLAHLVIPTYGENYPVRLMRTGSQGVVALTQSGHVILAEGPQLAP